MAVSNLGGIAFRFTGDGFHTQLVNAPCGGGGKLHAKTELLKKDLSNIPKGNKSLTDVYFGGKKPTDQLKKLTNLNEQ